ncbi:MAG: T9SS type A sorting domain-containing protein [Ignavibacteria bacterium]|nr:T9SS type A sorting domain-containing protein [Ignavibacteria bacterium]
MRIGFLFAAAIMVIAWTLNPTNAKASDPQWRVLGELKYGRHHHLARPIGNGKILVMGGYLNSRGILDGTPTSTCEIIDAFTGQISMGPDMAGTRAEFVCLTEPDGNLIIMGGVGSGSQGVERFDLKTQTWSTLGRMKVGRRQHSAAFVSPNEILVVAGYDLKSCEVFDVATGQSKLVVDYIDYANSVRALEFTTRHPGFYGGRSGGEGTPRSNYSFQYSVTGNKWSTDTDLFVGVAAPEVISLNDGTCIIVGGAVNETPSFVTSKAIVLAQPNGVGVSKGALKIGRQWHDIAEYNSGQIICAGGISDGVKYETSCEWIDIASGSTTVAPTLNYPHAFAEMVVVTASDGGKKAVMISGLTATGFTPYVEILESNCETGTTEVSLSNRGVYLVGSATFLDKRILLTDTAKYVAGAAWVKGKVYVASGFDVKFSYRMTKGSDGAQPDNGPVGADGVALVFQSQYQNSVGLAGRGMGYEKIVNGLAIEFDAYINAEYGDVAPSHIAVQKGDGRFLSSIHQPPYLLGMIDKGVPPFVSDGRIYYARVQYSGRRLKVFCDTTGKFIEPVLTIEDVDLMSILGNPKDGASYMGITSATGVSVQQHELLTWEISGCDALISSVEEDRTEVLSPYTVYPSPTTESSVLMLPEGVEHTTYIAVYSSNGEQVQQFSVPQSSNTVTLQAAELSNGVYLMVCRAGNEVHTVKWLISR